MKSFLRRYRMWVFVIGLHLMIVIVFGLTWAIAGLPDTLRSNLIEAGLLEARLEVGNEATDGH